MAYRVWQEGMHSLLGFYGTSAIARAAQMLKARARARLHMRTRRASGSALSHMCPDMCAAMCVAMCVDMRAHQAASDQKHARATHALGVIASTGLVHSCCLHSYGLHSYDSV